MSKKDTTKKRKKRRKAPIIIGAIVILAIGGIVIASKGKQTFVLVTTTSATVGDLQESISTSGTVVAEETKMYFAPVNGKIGEVRAVPGDAVKKGDLLIGYDTEDLERTFRQASLQQDKFMASYDGTLSNNAQNQAKLKEAETNIPILEQQIADNKSYLKDLQQKLSQNQRETSNGLAAESFNLNQKYSQLQDELGSLDPKAPEEAADYMQKMKEIKEVQSAMSQNSYLQQVAGASDYVVRMEKEISEVQERIADYEQYKAKMESQKAGSEAAVMSSYDKTQYEVELELAGMNFAEAEAEYYKGKAGICAGFDGIVTEVTAVEGSTVMEGAQLLKLESSEQVKVSFNASKWDLAKLAIGQKAELTISGEKYTGTVSRIDRMATMNMSNTPMVGVEIHIDKPDEKIILGLDAKITIYTQKAEGELLIPVEAVNADKEGDFLYVVEDGIAVRRPIVCGISNDTYTVVLEGITQEDQIVLTAIGDLEEGVAVTAMPESGEMAGGSSMLGGMVVAP